MLLDRESNSGLKYSLTGLAQDNAWVSDESPTRSARTEKAFRRVLQPQGQHETPINAGVELGSGRHNPRKLRHCVNSRDAKPDTTAITGVYGSQPDHWTGLEAVWTHDLSPGAI